MVQLIRSLVDFVINKSNSWGFKTAFIISLFGVIIGFDYITKISYHNHKNNQLNQLEKIISIKAHYKFDTISLEKIIKIESHTFNNSHYSETIDEFLFGKTNYNFEKDNSNSIDSSRNVQITDTLNSLTKSETQEKSTKLDSLSMRKNEEIEPAISSKNIEKIKSNIKDTRNLFWMVISSNYLIVLIALILLILPFVGTQKTNIDSILGLAASYVILGIWMTITTWISFKIPPLSANPIYNYSLNSIIHTLFIIFTFLVTKKNDVNT